MYKKQILCIFAVLIITITNSSYAFPAYSKLMSKRATLKPTKVTFNIRSEFNVGKFNITSKVGTSNTTEISVDDVNNLNAVGGLVGIKNDGSSDCCTASVIKTNTGNIAITAARCLVDINTKTYYKDMYFLPGYNGQLGKVGLVVAKHAYFYDSFMENPLLSDYGFIKFDYPEGKKLQDDTGAFDIDLDIPRDNYPVNVFGYPIGGEMNCTKDGQHLCEYEGNSLDMASESLRALTIDVGDGCSIGGPWVRKYDPATNAGNVMGVTYGILPKPYPGDTAAWSWTHDDFTSLLAFAEIP